MVVTGPALLLHDTRPAADSEYRVATLDLTNARKGIWACRTYSAGRHLALADHHNPWSALSGEHREHPQSLQRSGCRACRPGAAVAARGTAGAADGV